MGIAKKDVKNVEDLQEYLQDQTTKETNLYHYTTYESLIYIIENKSFRLSRMDLLNDKAEIKIGHYEENEQCYTMSFTREKEYISMWAMYGKPSGIKLRLDFPRKLFLESINNNFFYDSKLHERIPITSYTAKGPFSKKEFLVSDVVYLDKTSNELRHKENEFQSIKTDQHLINKMTGFIKYDAWEFEREIRLMVRLIEHYHDNNRFIPTHIYAGISRDLINSFHITFNPWIPQELKDEIKYSLKHISGSDIICDNSQNDGEIAEL